MVKQNTKMNSRLLLLAAFVWFVIIAYIMAHTIYPSAIADRLGDPNGISTQLESFLAILIVVVSFLPSGLFLAYPYVVRNFTSQKVFRIIILSIAIALALCIPFSWYSFVVNFPK